MSTDFSARSNATSSFLSPNLSPSSTLSPTAPPSSSFGLSYSNAPKLSSTPFVGASRSCTSVLCRQMRQIR